MRISAPKFGHGLLRNWRLEPDILYLNHGGYGAPALTVSHAAEAWRQRTEANPTRFFEEALGPEIRRNADLLAEFLNGKGHDLVFVDNPTLVHLLKNDSVQVVTPTNYLPALTLIGDYPREPLEAEAGGKRRNLCQ